MSKLQTYKDTVRYLYGLQKYGIKFGLNKTSNLLRALGDPHLGQPYIHIAGSNGKGSTAAMIESILIQAGFRVGFYSSPHLVRFTERFRINRKEIAREAVVTLTQALLDVIDQKEPPTFFEAATAMALLYFAGEQTDISIMEVGMGGRLDATNVIRPLVSVITNISLDHQFFLGSRLLDIAGEKAGIIKEGVDLVTAASQPGVIELFKGICDEKRAPFHRIGKEVRYRTRDFRFHYYGLKRNIRDMELGLRGRFQSRNAALALAVTELLEMKGFAISSTHMREGVKNTAWPGRMHIIARRPTTILDGAHNPQAVKELVTSIEKDFQYRRMILVLGVMEDKDINRMLKKIVPISDYVIYTKPGYTRSADPAELMRLAAPLGKPGEVVGVIPKAIEKAREISEPEDLILIAGSLFTVGEAISCLDPANYKPDET